MSAVPVSFNGELLIVEAATLDALLRQRGYALDAAMACAVNGSFVPRAQWAEQALRPNDRIDVVAPVTGG
jgi:sulfur carrier protein